MKKCIKCGEEKELEHFYRHSKMSDGTLNKCKDCCRKDGTQNWHKKADSSFYEKERSRWKERYNKEKRSESRINYHRQFPEKLKAKTAAQRLPKKPGFINHHWSYNDEHLKDIIQVPATIHSMLHKKIVYVKDKKVFSVIETKELLDTKEKHTAFIDRVYEIKSTLQCS